MGQAEVPCAPRAARLTSARATPTPKPTPVPESRPSASQRPRVTPTREVTLTSSVRRARAPRRYPNPSGTRDSRATSAPAAPAVRAQCRGRPRSGTPATPSAPLFPAAPTRTVYWSVCRDYPCKRSTEGGVPQLARTQHPRPRRAHLLGLPPASRAPARPAQRDIPTRARPARSPAPSTRPPRPGPPPLLGSSPPRYPHGPNPASPIRPRNLKLSLSAGVLTEVLRARLI